MTVPDSPENKCPRCGSEDPLIVGEACGYHPLHTPHRWHVEAPRVGGSGRINTSAEEARNQGDFLGDDLSGEHSCHAGCPCHAKRVEARDRLRASLAAADKGENDG